MPQWHSFPFSTPAKRYVSAEQCAMQFTGVLSARTVVTALARMREGVSVAQACARVQPLGRGAGGGGGGATGAWTQSTAKPHSGNARETVCGECWCVRRNRSVAYEN